MTKVQVCPAGRRGSDRSVDVQLVLAWALWCGVLSVLLVRVIDD
jgi:hypothetical protein